MRRLGRNVGYMNISKYTLSCYANKRSFPASLSVLLLLPNTFTMLKQDIKGQKNLIHAEYY